MNRLITLILALLPLAVPAQGGRSLVVPGKLVFSRTAFIPDRVRHECSLEEAGDQRLREALQADGIHLLDAGVAAPQVPILSVEISAVTAHGHALPRHDSSVTLSGRLSAAGQDLGSFNLLHKCSAGILRSACDVLYDCVGDAGGEIAQWLHAPERAARLEGR